MGQKTGHRMHKNQILDYKWNMLESLSERVMKIQNNFRKSVTSELEKCAEKCREEIVHIEKKTLTAGR